MRLSEMRTEVTPQKINKVMESRFGFTVDYDNLTYAKAQRLSKALSENIGAIKKSFGSHTAEKNPKYMELMLVKEGLDRWMSSEQGLFESEMGKSEAVLAAKDIVDSLQDMLEKVSKVQNEQVPALVDTIRDQIGAEQAEAFKSAITPLLGNLYQSLASGREQADTAVRQLAGEEAPAGDMAMGGGAMGGGADLNPDAGGELGGLGAAPESDLDMDTDGFDATDAAAGGEEELGRERR
ncbi:hypothetical protein UFOVP190_224 [uncultured Caudovirales phage]|uniref:Uncharacterized protein n=1 Tax=uncultured Caudovirales phage TaxID=2100421 RepID=A0A6J7WM54_9CAUD|nr:hypothetical protein UFOVP190_224 [uncultured Caudovirales phage]